MVGSCRRDRLLGTIAVIAVAPGDRERLAVAGRSRHAFRRRHARVHAILRHPDGRILERGVVCLEFVFSLQNLLALADVVVDGAVAPVTVAVEVIEKDAVPLARRSP